MRRISLKILCPPLCACISLLCTAAHGEATARRRNGVALHARQRVQAATNTAPRISCGLIQIPSIRLSRKGAVALHGGDGKAANRARGAVAGAA